MNTPQVVAKMLDFARLGLMPDGMTRRQFRTAYQEVVLPKLRKQQQIAKLRKKLAVTQTRSNR